MLFVDPWNLLCSKLATRHNGTKVQVEMTANEPDQRRVNSSTGF